MPIKFNINNLPQASDTYEVSGVYRGSPQDFVVVESLGFEPTEEGEHAFLTIQKEGRNTEDVARTLARHANVPRKAVSYAGLKDRRAVTTQYFSVHLPGQPDPDWSEIADSGISVLAVTRHQKKLKRGALKENHFQLMIRNISGERDLIEQRLVHVRSNGVPNYFMSQRFGHNAANLDQADAMLLQGHRVKDRFKRTMYYSAARSWLFNQVLAGRIKAENWNAAVKGDAMMLSGSRSCFHVETVDGEIKKRVSELDISATGPLWGRGESLLTDAALDIEKASLEEWGDWQRGLEEAGLQMARRSLRMKVIDLNWEWKGENQLLLNFSLYPGSYATALLRELGNITEATLNTPL